MNMIDCAIKMLDKLSPLKAVSDWPIRLSLGATFLAHGIGKLPNIPAGAMKFGVAEPIWMLVALAEIFGALAILIGGLGTAAWQRLLSRIGFLSLMPVMIGAIMMVRWPNWRFNNGGMEFEVLILAVCLYGLIADLKRS